MGWRTWRNLGDLWMTRGVRRELAKQYASQGEAGNKARLAAVNRHLRDRVAVASGESAPEADRPSFGRRGGG
jgi:hypothetical protein